MVFVTRQSPFFLDQQKIKTLESFVGVDLFVEVVNQLGHFGYQPRINTLPESFHGKLVRQVDLLERLSQKILRVHQSEGLL